MATTTSDSDRPSLRRRATARIGLFAAAATLATLSSLTTSAPADASQGDLLCASRAGCDGSGSSKAAPATPAGTNSVVGREVASPLDGVIRGLDTSNLLGGLGVPLSGGGLLGGAGGLLGGGGPLGGGGGPLGGGGGLPIPGLGG